MIVASSVAITDTIRVSGSIDDSTDPTGGDVGSLTGFGDGGGVGLGVILQSGF